MSEPTIQPRPPRWLENRIPPPLVLLLTGAAMWGASWLAPPVPLDDTVRYLIATAFALLGLMSAALGFRAFARAGTTIDPVHISSASAVVSGGIFRYTRNPMYLGMTTLLLGWAVFLSAPTLLLGPVLFALFITRFQIIPEERAMGTKFGKEYADYRGRARRWL